MPPPARIFVIVPAYNEGRVLRASLKPLLGTGYSIVVVDDGSTDNTWRQLASLAVHRVRHPFNLGQGAALQTATSYALEAGAEYILHYDADGQHRVEDIPSLLEPVLRGEADVALGSRFLRRDDLQAVPFSRRLLLKGAVLVNWLLTGLWLSDAHNGFRALSRAAAQKIVLRENGFAHASEILQQIRTHRLRFVERPTRIRYTEYSLHKGQRFWHAFDVLVDLLIKRVFR
ncbi:MAG: glycosyltransferase family 2 protein [Anaerolineales bacterium]|nr:glycosyltransferase family 2 protein [Anaerolineales bacterium]